MEESNKNGKKEKNSRARAKHLRRLKKNMVPIKYRQFSAHKIQTSVEWTPSFVRCALVGVCVYAAFMCNANSRVCVCALPLPVIQTSEYKHKNNHKFHRRTTTKNANKTKIRRRKKLVENHSTAGHPFIMCKCAASSCSVSRRPRAFVANVWRRMGWGLVYGGQGRQIKTRDTEYLPLVYMDRWQRIRDV